MPKICSFKNQFELNDVAQHEFTVLTAVWTCCDLIYSVIRPAQSKASSVALLLAISEPLVKWQNHFTHLELFLWQGNALPRVSHFRQFHLFLPSAAGPVRTRHRLSFVSLLPQFPAFPLKTVQTFKRFWGGVEVNGDDWCQGFCWLSMGGLDDYKLATWLICGSTRIKEIHLSALEPQEQFRLANKFQWMNHIFGWIVCFIFKIHFKSFYKIWKNFIIFRIWFFKKFVFQYSTIWQRCVYFVDSCALFQDRNGSVRLHL